MYLLYVNDIMDSNMISDLNMFADDIAIVAHGSVLTDVIDKTKCMYFGKGLYEENHMLGGQCQWSEIGIC